LLVDNLKDTNYKVIKNAIDVEKFKFNQNQRIAVRKELGIDNTLIYISEEEGWKISHFVDNSSIHPPKRKL